MSMEISNNQNNYQTSTVEFKTSVPGETKTAQIKTGFQNVEEYSQYLQEKYSYMNTGTTSMQGIPTTVNVSSAFLKQCMNNPEKAKFLEENLAAIPNCVKSLESYTKTMPGSPVCTYTSYTIDANGNISCASGCTNDPDGKIARENAERKAQEKRTAEKKAAKRRDEKRKAEKEAEEKLLAKLSENEYHYNITGTSVKSVTWSMTNLFFNNMSPIQNNTVGTFDMKA